MKYIPLQSTDKMLKSVAENYNFHNPQIPPSILCKNMLETLDFSKLSAVSAIQVGLPFRMFVMKTDGKVQYVFNPRIVDSGKDKVNIIEGDINHMGLKVKVSRPYSIKVRFQTETGETITKIISDIEARLYQMMTDSLNGVIFYESANFLNKNKAIKDWKNIQRKVLA